MNVFPNISSLLTFKDKSNANILLAHVDFGYYT